MMQPVPVPTTDVNSEQAVITEWVAGDGTPVRRGDPVAEVETSKSVIEVDAPADGFLLHTLEVGAEFDLALPIGHLFDTLDELERHRQERARISSTMSTSPNGGAPARASKSAQELAAAHGLDLSNIEKRGLITESDVKAMLDEATPVVESELPDPLQPDDPDVCRVVVIGAGLGATQVMDILHHDDGKLPVAVVDDDPALWGNTVGATPVVGGSERLAQLFERGAFDAAIISVSTSVAVRARFRALCEERGLPLSNAIDPTARIATGVTLGSGNVVCAFCHFGVGTTVGDNNFFSAYNSFDHHSVLGSDISTGPGCMTSGLVSIADGVRMGTGVFVEPKVSIGRDSVVASGSIVVRSIPDGHIVKARSGATDISPIRRTQ